MEEKYQGFVMFIIIGGSSGIGRALAKALSTRRVNVLIIGRHQDTLEKTSRHSKYISFFVADISKASGRKQLCNYIKHLPLVSGLIHCEGVIEPIEPINELTPQQLQTFFATNFFAPFYITQQLHNYLLNSKILFLESNMSQTPVVGMFGYCTSKAALSMAIKCFKIEYPQLVITKAMPGIVNTSMVKSVITAKSINPQYSNLVLSSQEKHYLVEPETTALFLTWLLLDVDLSRFASNDWNIYDSSHHPYWLVPPHKIVKVKF